MSEFFANLFNTAGFPPRWPCGTAWTSRSVGKRPVDSMLLRSVVSLAILAILTSFFFSIVVKQANIAANDARWVNLCGRQRLLLVLTTCQLERVYAKQLVTDAEARDLKRRLRELEQTHLAFAYGDVEMQIPKPSGKVYDTYFETPHKLQHAMMRTSVWRVS